MIAKNFDGANVLDEGTAGHRNHLSRIQRQRIRAPRLHGETLQRPPLNQAKQLLEENIKELTTLDTVTIGSISRFELSRLGRKEVFELARKHTDSYRSSEEIIGHQPHLDRIIMSGHQPTLFHPGVWYKNFALSRLGSDLGCTAINLVVDSDLCGVSTIKVPQVDTDAASFGFVAVDAPGDNIPFEAKQIVDRKLFDSFASRIKTAIGSFVDDPIVEPLWAISRDLHLFENRIGATIAASRHALEFDLGLRTLEVPLSHIAQTVAFAHFSKHLLNRAAEFRNVYNRTLMNYRARNGIRSNSHPVPPLEIHEQWTETPFWIWNIEHPVRNRLFSRVENGTIHLTNRRDVHVSLENGSFVEAFCELTSSGIAVRPRALTTTLFSRLFLSDLFIHGIGGAKYDELTDVIIADFFGAPAPRFLTLTATTKLPFGEKDVSRHDLTRINHQLRELTFHPEAQISHPSIELGKLVAGKHEWIRRDVPKGRPGGKRRQWHLEIEKFNQKLQPFVEKRRQALRQQRRELEKQLDRSRVTGSREYSFCLFPLDLTQQLLALAN